MGPTFFKCFLLKKSIGLPVSTGPIDTGNHLLTNNLTSFAARLFTVAKLVVLCAKKENKLGFVVKDRGSG